MFQASKAQREKVKLMIGLDGPTGSGKTLSALKMAHGIAGDWSKIALADTENNSALYYAGDTTSNDWEHIPFESEMPGGYSPANYVKLIEYAETMKGIEVLIIDSISHEWNGAGGCLEIVNNIGGNSFTAWKKVTPMHNAFIDKMRHSKLHIIATMRSKQDYVLEENEKGRAVPKKVGLASVQREGTDYEFGVIFSIGLNHMATVEKDRTNMFLDRPPFMINEAVGKELKGWAIGGSEPIYNGSAGHKKELMNIAKEIKSDVAADTLKKIHEKCIGQKLSDLKTIVKKELK